VWILLWETLSQGLFAVRFFSRKSLFLDIPLFFYQFLLVFSRSKFPFPNLKSTSILLWKLLWEFTNNFLKRGEAVSKKRLTLTACLIYNKN